MNSNVKTTNSHVPHASSDAFQVSWPLPVLDLRPDSQGRATLITQSPSGSLAGKKSQVIAKPALNNPIRLKWLLNAVGVVDFILCDGLFSIKSKKGDVDGIWKTIKATPHLKWILTVSDPVALVSHLPNDWGETGYPNVCFALVLDGDPKANLRQLQALKQTPARYRALWIRSGHGLEMPDDWLDGIDWIIADTTNEGPSPLPEASIEWVTKIRAACRAKGLAFLHNHVADEGSAVAVDGMDDPFAKEIAPVRPTKLARMAKPDSAATPEMPSPVDISAANDTTVVELSVTNGSDVCDEVTDASMSEALATTLTVPDNSYLGVFVPEIVADFRIDEVGIDTKRARFDDLDATVRSGLKGWIDAGIALREIRDDQLWRDGGYASFEDYCTIVLGFATNYANRIAKHAGIALELSKARGPMDKAGNPIIPQNESQVRALAKLEGLPQWLKAWKLSVKRASGMPTGAIVNDVVCELKAKNSPPKVPAPSRKDMLKDSIRRLRQAIEEEHLDLALEILTELEAAASKSPTP